MARFFCIFHALSFELNFFFDRRFPLNEQILRRILIDVQATIEKSDISLFRIGNP